MRERAGLGMRSAVVSESALQARDAATHFTVE